MWYHQWQCVWLACVCRGTWATWLSRDCFLCSGPRIAYLNMEARSEFTHVLNRRCVFVRWSNFSLNKFDDLVERGAGALIIILPVTEETNISMATREEWMQMERELLLRDITIPIYFMTENEVVLEIMECLDQDALEQNGSSVVSGKLEGLEQGWSSVWSSCIARLTAACLLQVCLAPLKGVDTMSPRRARSQKRWRSQQCQRCRLCSRARVCLTNCPQWPLWHTTTPLECQP